MRKITFLFVFIILGTLSSLGQILNQPANWPNAGWTLSGTYTAGGLLSNPTVTGSTFSFDDDAAGNGSADTVIATSPVIDLTAASGGGETWISVSGSFVYRALGGDVLAIQVYNADTMTWTSLQTFAGNSTNTDFQTCAGTVAYTSAVLDISGFTATQLSGFQYRFSYNDQGGWQWGYCVTSPTITSATPPSCLAPSTLTVSNLTTTSANLGWTENGSATTWDIEWGTDGFTPTGTPNVNDTGDNPYTLSSLTEGTGYDFYVRSDCGMNDTEVSVWVGPFSFTTAFTAPNCASNPSPADGAIDVPTGDVTFSWVAPADGPAPTSYNLYAGLESDGSDLALVANFPTETAEITITGYSTTFYWLVLPMNNSTEASGCALWSFTTGDAPVGAVCEDSIVVNTLPYTTSDDTSSYGNDYTTTDRPALTGAQVANGSGNASYMTGDDVVYSFTPAADGVFNFNATFPTSDWFSLWLFEGCAPFTSVIAYHTAIDGTTRSLPQIDLIGGTTYYVVISTWPAPQSTPYTLDITEEPLSLADVENINAFTYFPNPVKNELTLKAQSNIQNVSIYNMLGQEVLRIAPNTLESDINMNALQTGAYFVKVTINDATETIRVIKQ